MTGLTFFANLGRHTECRQGNSNRMLKLSFGRVSRVSESQMKNYMGSSIVSVKNLSHRYSVQWAIKDISFDITKKGVMACGI